MVRALQVFAHEGPDPSEASAQAFVSVRAIDAWADSFDDSQARRSKGGKSRARDRADQAKAEAKEIRDRATKLLSDDREPKDIAGIISTTTGHSLPKIYRALRAHPTGHWSKKR